MADQVTDEADVMLTSVESPTITADWFDLTRQESNSFLEEDVLLFFIPLFIQAQIASPLWDHKSCCLWNRSL